MPTTKKPVVIQPPEKPNVDEIADLEIWCAKTKSDMDKMQAEANDLYAKADALIVKGREVAALYNARSQQLEAMKEKRDEKRRIAIVNPAIPVPQHYGGRVEYTDDDPITRRKDGGLKVDEFMEGIQIIHEQL